MEKDYISDYLNKYEYLKEYFREEIPNQPLYRQLFWIILQVNNNRIKEIKQKDNIIESISFLNNKELQKNELIIAVNRSEELKKQIDDIIMQKNSNYLLTELDNANILLLQGLIDYANSIDIDIIYNLTDTDKQILPDETYSKITQQFNSHLKIYKLDKVNVVNFSYLEKVNETIKKSNSKNEETIGNFKPLIEIGDIEIKTLEYEIEEKKKNIILLYKRIRIYKKYIQASYSNTDIQLMQNSLEKIKEEIKQKIETLDKKLASKKEEEIKSEEKLLTLSAIMFAKASHNFTNTDAIFRKAESEAFAADSAASGATIAQSAAKTLQDANKKREKAIAVHSYADKNLMKHYHKESYQAEISAAFRKFPALETNYNLGDLRKELDLAITENSKIMKEIEKINEGLLLEHNEISIIRSIIKQIGTIINLDGDLNLLDKRLIEKTSKSAVINEINKNIERIMSNFSEMYDQFNILYKYSNNQYDIIRDSIRRENENKDEYIDVKGEGILNEMFDIPPYYNKIYTTTQDSFSNEFTTISSNYEDEKEKNGSFSFHLSEYLKDNKSLYGLHPQCLFEKNPLYTKNDCKKMFKKNEIHQEFDKVEEDKKQMLAIRILQALGFKLKINKDYRSFEHYSENEILIKDALVLDDNQELDDIDVTQEKIKDIKKLIEKAGRIYLSTNSISNNRPLMNKNYGDYNKVKVRSHLFGPNILMTAVPSVLMTGGTYEEESGLKILYGGGQIRDAAEKITNKLRNKLKIIEGKISKEQILKIDNKISSYTEQALELDELEERMIHATIIYNTKPQIDKINNEDIDNLKSDIIDKKKKIESNFDKMNKLSKILHPIVINVQMPYRIHH
jgi:hypothetical protein